MFESILERKKKLGIFPKGLLLVLVKNWQFFHLFNIGKKDKKNVSENILERTKAFPDYKNNKLKNSKIWDFSKENTVGVILIGGRVILVCDWCARVQQF